MNNTLETLNIKLKNQIKELEIFKNNPSNENFEDGIETLEYEIDLTKKQVIETIAFNDSEKEIALQLLCR